MNEIQPQPEDKYKTFGPRFGAGFLDGLALGILGLFMSGIALIISDDPENIIHYLLNLFEYYSGYLYSIILHFFYGQTIGKMLTGVKVVTFKGEKKLGLKHAILRDIIPIIAITVSIMIYFLVKYMGFEETPTFAKKIFQSINFLMLLWFVLELLTMLTNNKRRALHDFIAGTVVVRI